MGISGLKQKNRISMVVMYYIKFFRTVGQQKQR